MTLLFMAIRRCGSLSLQTLPHKGIKVFKSITGQKHDFIAITGVAYVRKNSNIGVPSHRALPEALESPPSVIPTRALLDDDATTELHNPAHWDYPVHMAEEVDILYEQEDLDGLKRLLEYAGDACGKAASEGWDRELLAEVFVRVEYYYLLLYKKVNDAENNDVEDNDVEDDDADDDDDEE